jgi:hypothetical protein
MLFGKFNSIAAAALTLAGLLAAKPVDAAPYVDIKASWSVDFRNQLPGIAVSCFGAATAYSNGCAGSAWLNSVVADSGTLTADSSGGIMLTNTTDHPMDGSFSLHSVFSAFNPGGPPIGIGIDNPATQAARFLSWVSGPGVGDSHNCSVGFLGTSGTVFSPTTCGVNAPDSSELSFGVALNSLAPNAQMLLTYDIGISATFDLPAGVPEPGSAVILLGGLMALGWHYRRCLQPTRPQT